MSGLFRNIFFSTVSFPFTLTSSERLIKRANQKILHSMRHILLMVELKTARMLVQVNFEFAAIANIPCMSRDEASCSSSMLSFIKSSLPGTDTKLLRKNKASIDYKSLFISLIMNYKFPQTKNSVVFIFEQW